MAISQHLMQDSIVHTDALEWVTQTLQNPLPSVTDSASSLLKAQAGKNLSYQAVSDVLGKDPVLTLQLLNQANLGTLGGEGIVKTLQQALGLMGMDFLEDQLRNAQPPQCTDVPGAMEYYKSLAISFCAAHLAEEIARSKLPDRQQELYWSALFYGLPMWYLWYFNAEKMQCWQRSLDQSERQRSEHEIRTFGTPFVNVWSTIHANFALSESITANPLFTTAAARKMLIKLAKHCPLRGNPGSPHSREEMLLLNSPGFIVALSNAIAFQANQSPNSPLLRKLCLVLATLLKKPLKETLTLLHKLVVISARQHPLPWGHCLAEQLIWGPQLPEPESPGAAISKPGVDNSEFNKHTTNGEPMISAAPAVAEQTPAPAVGTVSERPASGVEQSEQRTKQASRPPVTPAAKSRSGNKKLFIEITEAMLRTPAEFNNTARLMNAASRCITYGIGLQTSVVTLINQQRSRLKGYYATGTEDRPNLARIDIDLTTASIFHTLMQRPSGIWVKPHSSAKVHDMIPEDFSSINNTSDFFLMSCFMKNRSVALFYADAGVNALPLTEYEYSCFKKICGSVSQVLVYIAQTKKANSVAGSVR